MITNKLLTLAICLLALTACTGGAKRRVVGTESDRLYKEVMVD